MKSVRNKEFHVGPSTLNTLVYKVAFDALCKDLNPGESTTTTKKKRKKENMTSEI